MILSYVSNDMIFVECGVYRVMVGKFFDYLDV